MRVRIIEVRPFWGGWKVFESQGVEPFWTGDDARRQAIRYSLERSQFGRCEIRIKDAVGNVVQTIRPDLPQTDPLII